MKNKGTKRKIIGFAAVSITGTLCHFVYEWSGYNYAVGMLCPINESPWEHLKMLWFPFLLWSLTEYFILKRPQGFWLTKCIGNLTGLAVTTSFFYTYSGIMGKNTLFWDVCAFFLGVSAAFLTDDLLQKAKFSTKPQAQIIGIAVIIVLSVLFMIFSFLPPLIPWFRDPNLLTYGI